MLARGSLQGIDRCAATAILSNSARRSEFRSLSNDSEVVRALIARRADGCEREQTDGLALWRESACRLRRAVGTVCEAALETFLHRHRSLCSAALFRTSKSGDRGLMLPLARRHSCDVRSMAREWTSSCRRLGRVSFGSDCQQQLSQTTLGPFGSSSHECLSTSYVSYLVPIESINAHHLGLLRLAQALPLLNQPLAPHIIPQRIRKQQHHIPALLPPDLCPPLLALEVV